MEGLERMLLAIKVLVIAYVAGMAFLYFFQSRILFHPQTNALIGAKEFEKYEIRVKHGDVVLQGWFVPREPIAQQPLIIYYGGNAEDVSANLLFLKRYPKASLLFMNYRAYGGSTGRPSETHLFGDALFMYDHIQAETKIAPERIILFGRSLGSGVAVHVARHRPSRAVILVSPYDSILNIGRQYYPMFPIRWLLRQPFNVEPLAAEIKRPLLALIAGRDRTVPPRRSRALVDAWAGPKRTVLLENADHNSIFDESEYWRSVDDFVNNVLK